ncbi:hypothetical protein PG988_014499 [Apiospora saccharicola]
MQIYMLASRFLSIFGLCCLPTAKPCQICTFEDIIPSRTLLWCPCYNRFSCARLDVSHEFRVPICCRYHLTTTTLTSTGPRSPLIKLSAKTNPSSGPYQGMMLMNPGVSGVEFALEQANVIQEIAGDNWDIIGGAKRAGPHMSTATTARDMLSIANAFAATQDGRRGAKTRRLLNYYGIIGAFFVYCHRAGAARCPYDVDPLGFTAMEMYARFNRSFAQLDAQRALNENWTNATAIESALLLLKVGWLTAANDTLALESALSSQNLEPWISEATKAFGGPIGASYTNAEETLDVLCSDQGNAWYGRTLEDLRAPLGRLERQSIVGESHALRKQHLRPRHAP